MARRVAVALLFAAEIGSPAIAADRDPPLHLLQLPPGFVISVYADDLPDARQMARASDGTLFVGTRRAGRVYAVRDTDGDGDADDKRTVLSGLDLPSGIAFHRGALFVAAVNRILRYDHILDQLDDPPYPAVVVSGLPDDRYHAWRHLDVGPDGRLYLTIGSPCDICRVADPYAAILVVDEADGTVSPYARGVRNAQGLDWHPVTGTMWFTDTGRNHLGDDLPAGELNRADRAGLDFGFPYCHGGQVPDPEFGHERPCRDFVPPVAGFPAHSTPLGIVIYDGDNFPADYRHQAIVAEHGSWDRATPIGYRLSIVRLADDGTALSYGVFVDGWLQGNNHWGRPADLLILPDGTLLVSDDDAGVIYRISYVGS